MKKFPTFLFILLVCFTFLSACRGTIENPRELEVHAVYSYHGYIYYQFEGFGGLYLAPDCPANIEPTDDYAGIRVYYDNFANQVIELIKAKDMQIESAEGVIEAQKEYMKINGLIK
jgi:hypothetical protein